MIIRRRKEIMWFSRQMEIVLRNNDFKGGWKHCSHRYLLASLDQERDELMLALNNPRSINEDVINECVDIANFAMMIAENFRENGS